MKIRKGKKTITLSGIGDFAGVTRVCVSAAKGEKYTSGKKKGQSKKKVCFTHPYVAGVLSTAASKPGAVKRALVSKQARARKSANAGYDYPGVGSNKSGKKFTKGMRPAMSTEHMRAIVCGLTASKKPGAKAFLAKLKAKRWPACKSGE